MIKLKAHAKINLALEVMDTEGGFHKVNNIMIPINLSDDIEIKKAETTYVVDNTIPDNIMIKAANLFFQRFNIDGGVEIRIDKHIPVSAGLAGGSTDAGAILRGLNELYGVNASVTDLMDIASRLGSDVPFFIEEKCALCTNRGEVINKVECNLEPLDLLLIKVNKGTSTKEVYQNYSYSGVLKVEELNAILRGLRENDKELVIKNIFNDLTTPALKVNDELRACYNKLIDSGLDAKISGSGPTIFIVNPTPEEIKLVEDLLDNSILKIRTNTI